ncbi:MAG: hypothetical protein JWP89_611 [Schlesneria sp.]|nr:hypothetical protein [Schlesneria sp.]
MSISSLFVLYYRSACEIFQGYQIRSQFGDFLITPIDASGDEVSDYFAVLALPTSCGNLVGPKATLCSESNSSRSPSNRRDRVE